MYDTSLHLRPRRKETLEQGEMEADEEERELCADFLENWNTPAPVNSISEQNPFAQFDVEEANTKIWTSKQGDVIPVLVADTFYDKKLGHATDGIDIAAFLSSSPCFNFNNPRPRAAKYRRLSTTTQHDFVCKLRIMLCSNKAIEIDDFGEKMWRNPGADTTDFFNYGLDEKQWKDYLKEMHALIHEQSRGPTQTSIHSIEEGEILEH